MISIARRARPAAYRLSLLTSVAMMVPAMTLVTNVAAHAQPGAVQAKQNYDIPAQPLPAALRQFMQQSGIQVAYASDVGTNVSAAAIKGSYTPSEALSLLIAGTGLVCSQTGSRTFTLVRPGRAEDGVVQLGVLRVGGSASRADTSKDPGASEFLEVGVGDGRSDARLLSDTYRGVGTSAHISQQAIQRFRGTSTGDFLSGIPGVMNGENRNSGALDVNIRGLQGMGRSPVVLDGAMQEGTVYRGYAGMAGRTYIDPDMIGGMSIEKGPSMGADATGAIGGILRARTINAGDIVAPGGSWGIVLRGSRSGNNSTPPPHATIGGTEPAVRIYDRPTTLDLKGWSGSAAVAHRTAYLDIVAAYAQRENGNYFAGSTGRDVSKWNGGPHAFGYGEQVINTSQKNKSYLVRATIRPSTVHTLDLTYMRYNTVFGEMKPSQLLYGDIPYQTISKVHVDTFTNRYRFKPSGSLIDLRADVWATRTDSFTIDPVRLDYGGGYIDNSDMFSATLSKRWGATVSNASSVSGQAGKLTLKYGFAYDYEDLGKSSQWASLNARYPGRAWDSQRDGWRRQWSGFTDAEYRPAPWAVLTAGTRYLNTVIQDNNVGTSWAQGGLRNRDHARGWSPSVSALVEPVRGLQFYARYASALRAPSSFEGMEGFAVQVNPYTNLKPERNHSVEAGVNYQANSLLRRGDLFQLKFDNFNNEIRNYITRSSERLTTSSGSYSEVLVSSNIPKVVLRGFELSARYDVGMMYVDFSGTRYTAIRSCYAATSTSAVRCYHGMPSDSQSWFVNQMPPKLSLATKGGIRLLDDRLELGARYSYIDRDPSYDLIDLYTNFDITPRIGLGLAVDNLMDRYYVEPLSLGAGVALMPGPGRTVRANLVIKLGDGTPRPPSSRRDRDSVAEASAMTSLMQPFNGSWRGPYLGVDAGSMLFHTKTTVRSGTGVESAVAARESDSFDAHSIVGGLHAGYLFQNRRGLVWGFEVDSDLMRARRDRSSIAPELDTGRYQSDQIIEAKYHHSFRSAGSARVRVGQALGRALFYGTGGLMLIDEKVTRTQYRSDTASASRPFGYTTSPYFNESTKKLHLGVNLGAGAEVAFNNHLSLRAEYLVGIFGSETFRFDQATANVNRSYTSRGVTTTGGSSVAIGRNMRETLLSHALRMGISYRF